MQVKRYEATSIQEAMAKIRNDLGQDAVILSTKRLRRGKIPLIEVTAARDVGRVPADSPVVKASAILPAPMPGGMNLKSEIDEIKQMLAEFKRENSLRTDVMQLKETVNTLFDLVGAIKKEQGYFSAVYHHLLACGISRERAYKMMDYVKNEYRTVEKDNYSEVLQGLEELIKKTLSGPEKRESEKRALAFIGPTGVGKTTTLAKLAAAYALEGKKKVGLIATDTYRIAAPEQLKVYADIMGIPVEIASDRNEFKKAWNKLSDRDMILIDTPGRNPSDESHMRKMADILNQAVPVNTCLLLSLTSSRENMLDAAAKFSIIPYHNIIFTKIDESATCGSIYDVVEQVRKPVPYLTNGQNVPKDIIKATPGRIAGMIMGNPMN
jgi:flagellar biosynthesis protein FlhF